jgi:hypothetical protein
MKYSITPIILLFIFISCQTTHFSSPEDCNGKQLIISEGGGVTGKITQTIILENGQVFIRTVNPQTMKESAEISRKTARDIFERLDALNLEELKFTHPGNMTYSIISKDGNETIEVKWGDPAFEVPAEIRQFYQYTRQQILSESL